MQLTGCFITRGPGDDPSRLDRLLCGVLGQKTRTPPPRSIWRGPMPGPGLKDDMPALPEERLREMLEKARRDDWHSTLKLRAAELDAESPRESAAAPEAPADCAIACRCGWRGFASELNFDSRTETRHCPKCCGRFTQYPEEASGTARKAPSSSSATGSASHTPTPPAAPPAWDAEEWLREKMCHNPTDFGELSWHRAISIARAAYTAGHAAGVGARLPEEELKFVLGVLSGFWREVYIGSLHYKLDVTLTPPQKEQLDQAIISLREKLTGSAL